MANELATHSQNPTKKWRRALYGAVVSLIVYALARFLAALVLPLDSSPFANLVLFMGTPVLILMFLIPGISSLGLAGANIINGICWALLGAIIGLLIRRTWVAVGVWLLVVIVSAALAFAVLIAGMMSSSP
jgi:hypothetical protein